MTLGETVCLAVAHTNLKYVVTVATLMQQRRKLNEISDAVLCAMKALEAILYSLQQQTVRKIKENLYRDTVTTAEH